MADTKTWMLLGGAEYGDTEIITTFRAADMGVALERCRSLVDRSKGSGCDWYELVRIGHERDDDHQVMWSWWTNGRGNLVDARGDHWKPSASSEQEGR